MQSVARRGCLTSSLRCLRHCTGSTSVRPATRSFSGSSVAASMRRLSRTLLASSPMLLPLRFCTQSQFNRPFHQVQQETAPIRQDVFLPATWNRAALWPPARVGCGASCLPPPLRCCRSSSAPTKSLSHSQGADCNRRMREMVKCSSSNNSQPQLTASAGADP